MTHFSNVLSLAFSKPEGLGERGGLGWLRHLWNRLWHSSLSPMQVVSLTKDDTSLLVMHFARLGAHDRSTRFNSNLSYSALSHRYHHIDWGRVCFLGVKAGQRLVAVAELAASNEEGKPVWEIGISVCGPWQHRGIGEALLCEALKLVCEEKQTSALVYTQVQNRPMMSLAKRLGGKGTMVNGECVFVFPPAALRVNDSIALQGIAVPD